MGLQEQDCLHRMVSRRGSAHDGMPFGTLRLNLDYLTLCLQPKMTYASTKESVKNALPGLGSEIQANSEDDIEYESILKSLTKGAR